MKKTLQDQYLLIKEGKGHVGVFLTEAKRQFPNIVRNAATFDEAVASLKTKNIISENVFSVMPAIMDRPKKESYETAFENFLAEARKENEDEKVKAEEKKVSKPVEKDLEKNFDYSDEKNPDNMIFDQIMMGYYAEMKDPKNADKTMQELKDIVFKNLSKDPIHYTKDGQFGIKDLGYTTEAPGLGEPKEAKGKYKSSGYGDLKESKEYYTDEDEEEEEVKDVRDMSWTKGFTKEEQTIREAVRKMIAEELEEAYQMISVNPSAQGGGGKRFIPKVLPFPQNIRKRFGEHIVYNPGSGTLYISDILYNNLVKGYGDQPAIKKLIMDIPPMVKQVLNKPDNYGPTTELPKEFRVYHPLSDMVEKAKSDKFNKDGTKQYWSEGDFLIPNLNVMEEDLSEGIEEWEKKWKSSAQDKETAMYFKRNMKPEEWNEFVSKYREDIRMALMESQSLKESVEKDLADINKEAEHEVLQAKLDKIDALIDHRRSKLGKLDEDEDMKALTDKKKVKELEKDIKKLEVARKKIEKMMSKFKGKKKEVIDEMEDDLDVNPEYVEDATERLDDGQSVDSIMSDYSNLGNDQEDDLKPYLNSIAPEDLKSSSDNTY